MFNKITDVPLEIRDFYQEITGKREKLNENGEIVTEDINMPSIDLEGNEIIITTKVPVLEEYTYIELISEPEQKSLGDVWRVATLHKGSRDNLVKLFLDMYNSGLQWGFYREYTQWYTKLESLKEDLISLPTVLVASLKGEEPIVDPSIYLKEQIQALESTKPVRPKVIDTDKWFLDNYYRLREIAYPSKERQLETQFDDQINGTTLWADALIKVRNQYPKPE